MTRDNNNEPKKGDHTDSINVCLVWCLSSIILEKLFFYRNSPVNIGNF